ncbi:MAG: sodium ion-translocating decarboxylase subunit beta [Lachnospiraceae bacterium]|nr:sodium ion-translocating decarboxylase subunit beta [Lachnospiraceae bacterium]
MGRKVKGARGVSIIGGADGPTSVFILSKNKKMTLKQRIHKWKYQRRKTWFEKHIVAGSHTMDEVCQYVQKELGYTAVSFDDEEYQRMYKEMRSSFIMQFAPELLGEYQDAPRLKSHSEEDVKHFMEELDVRQRVAQEVPKDIFDIEYHCFRKQIDATKYEICIEKRFGYIGGGYIGGGANRKSKKLAKQFGDEFKKVYQYYGVTQEDIDNKSKRYEELLRTLAMR